MAEARETQAWAEATVNVLLVGVGGQGVLKASQVLADALVGAGYDVKQSEVHGMSQRGGSVLSEVRFGRRVHSPLAPWKEADLIVALDEAEGRRAAARLRPGTGRLVEVPAELAAVLPEARSRNMAALGRLSALMELPLEAWHEAIRRCMPPKSVETNIAAFQMGRRSQS